MFHTPRCIRAGQRWLLGWSLSERTGAPWHRGRKRSRSNYAARSTPCTALSLLWAPHWRHLLSWSRHPGILSGTRHVRSSNDQGHHKSPGTLRDSVLGIRDWILYPLWKEHEESISLRQRHGYLHSQSCSWDYHHSSLQAWLDLLEF